MGECQAFFGDKIWVSSAALLSLPSPEALKGKILIKGKRGSLQRRPKSEYIVPSAVGMDQLLKVHDFLKSVQSYLGSLAPSSSSSSSSPLTSPLSDISCFLDEGQAVGHALESSGEGKDRDASVLSRLYQILNELSAIHSLRTKLCSSLLRLSRLFASFDFSSLFTLSTSEESAVTSLPSSRFSNHSLSRSLSPSVNRESRMKGKSNSFSNEKISSTRMYIHTSHDADTPLTAQDDPLDKEDGGNPLSLPLSLSLSLSPSLPLSLPLSLRLSLSLSRTHSSLTVCYFISCVCL
jgi:hypothetical protein